METRIYNSCSGGTRHDTWEEGSSERKFTDDNTASVTIIFMVVGDHKDISQTLMLLTIECHKDISQTLRLLPMESTSLWRLEFTTIVPVEEHHCGG
jgi:hypothetical protein